VLQFDVSAKYQAAVALTGNRHAFLLILLFLPTAHFLCRAYQQLQRIGVQSLDFVEQGFHPSFFIYSSANKLDLHVIPCTLKTA
jgi:hypothetical protein